MKDFLVNTLLTFAVVAVIASILYTPTVFISWMWHASNTADLTQIDKVIAINQEEYDRAANQVSVLTEGDATFRMNQDTPVASMVTAQIEFADKLVKAKVKKASLIASIVSRCNGPWGVTVWMFDDVPCADYRKM